MFSDYDMYQNEQVQTSTSTYEGASAYSQNRAQGLIDVLTKVVAIYIRVL